MLKRRFRTGFAILALSLSACDSADHAEQTPTPQTQSSMADETALDLSALDVCSILPDALVAQLLDNSITQPGRRRDYGPTVQGCEYVLGSAGGGSGGGGFEYVFVDVNAPGNFGTLEDALATDQGLGQEVSGEAVSGIGDQAFAVHNATERATTLYVLRQGRFALEVKANNLDHARKLAQASLERLGSI